MYAKISDPAEIARLNKELAKFGSWIDKGRPVYTCDEDAGIYHNSHPGWWLRINPETKNSFGGLSRSQKERGWGYLSGGMEV